MTLKGFLSRIVAAVFTVMICILVMEVGLRYLGRGPSNTFVGIFKEYKDFYRLRENMEKRINYPSYKYNVYTNSYGFRDKKIGGKGISNKPFYVFLGASEVFGNGVDFEKTFVGIFSEYASRKGIEVLNMAVGGHLFFDQERLLEDFIEDYQHYPEIVFFCVNDLIIPKFDSKTENIIVIHGQLFEKKSWRVAYLKNLFGNISGVYCFFRDKIRKLQLIYKGSASSDSLEFVDIYSKENSMHDPETVAKYEHHLEEFEDFCVQNGITPVYVYLTLADVFRFNDVLKSIGEDPDQYDTTYYEELMKSYCERRNVRLIDLRPLLKQYYEKGESLRFDLDAHFNEFANHVIGEYLVSEIFGADTISNSQI